MAELVMTNLRRFLFGLTIISLILILLVDSARARVSSSRGAVFGDKFTAVKIAPDVQSMLEAMDDGEMIAVIVTLKAQADLTGITDNNRRIRINRLINALKSLADATQRDIRELLNLRLSEGKVSQYESFWIFNGLAVTATSEVIDELAARPEVRSITPDESISGPAAGLALSGPAEPNLALINAPALWDLGFQGQGIVVANMDSGVDFTHPDLINRWRGGSNSWFDPNGEHPLQPFDASGHGTWTMGVLLGGDAGGTTIGVAPEAQWIAVKIFNDQGSATVSGIHAGFQWLLDPDGDPATADTPHVVNNSWTYQSPGCNLEFQLDLGALRAAGILPVFAAGNAGPNTSTSYSPANYPQAFAVGAINNSDQIYTYSSRGPSACGEAQTYYPEVVAPGVGIHTSDLYSLYYDATGTSLAAPHVSGSLALLLSAFPNLSAADQEYALGVTAMDLGPAGPDNDFGNGRLDILAAYQFLQSGGSAPTPTPLPTGSLNLALYKPVTVSSFQDGSTGGDQAVDGDLNTFWKTKRANGKNSPPSEWIKIDLGDSIDLSQVVLEWDTNYATSYTIEVSEDDNTWTTIFDTTNADGGNDTLTFSLAAGRYIMLETTTWNDNSLRNWLREFQVYGNFANPSPTSTPSATSISISPTPTNTPTSTPAPTEPTPTPTSTPEEGATVHVGDLDGWASPGSRNRWEASVSITVHDSNELPVSGATVSGTWSGGVSGNDGCVTDSNGQCVVIKGNIRNNIGSVIYSVTDISVTSFQYQSNANHDPDGDSDGTSITISKP